VHFLYLEPYETDKNVLKFTKNLVLKFHFLLLGALHVVIFFRWLMNVHITQEVCRADQFEREINLFVNSTNEVMLFAFT